MFFQCVAAKFAVIVSEIFAHPPSSFWLNYSGCPLVTYVENLEKAGSEQLSGNLQNVAIVERTVYVEFGKLWIQATD